MPRGSAITAVLAPAAALPMLVVATEQAEAATVIIDFEGLAEGSGVDGVSVGFGASGPAVEGRTGIRGERRAVPGVNRAMGGGRRVTAEDWAHYSGMAQRGTGSGPAVTSRPSEREAAPCGRWSTSSAPGRSASR